MSKFYQGGSQNFTKPLVKKTPSQETVLQETVNNKNVNVGKSKSKIKKLPLIEQPQGKVKALVMEIIEQLGDEKSKQFYTQVAERIPESVVRLALSNIKAEPPQSPPKVFTKIMLDYAEEQIKQNKVSDLKKKIKNLTAEKDINTS